ncbi:GNAT family N-acetyltransferase [Catenulispora subtropica]|uniref:GNAT family N-acetyltransferase n=1 Tax=Catenulispora subtropica TaxID=450798 RepID=A0ABN2QP83_9ACTN
MNDEVTVIDNKERHRYEARLGGELAGVLTYTVEDGVAVLPHTGVEPRFEGRGIGGRLAKAALDDAREAGLKVAPWCPFIAAYIEKNPEYRDLVAPGA